MEHDVHELIGKVAEQNGIRLDHDDPAFALVTLNEIVLKATADHLRREIQSTVDSFSDSVQRLEARAGAVLAHEVRQVTTDVRRHLATDLAVAGMRATELVKQVQTARERPTVLRWATIGLLAAGFLLTCGFLAGRLSVRYF
jgi:hypothetical protein